MRFRIWFSCLCLPLGQRFGRASRKDDIAPAAQLVGMNAELSSN
ncbi:MAG: hypothetical protein ACR2P3_09150 [Geminicoccaceae bacterium]